MSVFHLMKTFCLWGGALTALVLSGCKPEPKRFVPLPTEVYVWQRAWKPELAESVEQSKSWVQTYHLLMAEVGFEKGKGKITRIQADPTVMKSQKVGLVLRVFPSAAKTGWGAEATKLVVDLAKETVSAWPAGNVAELQLDYDCPDSKLVDYIRLLTEVKAALFPLKVTCTVLPSWLRQKEFSALAAIVPGYVLQVHSLHLPKTQDKAVALVDLAETRNALAQAVTIGVPFRVALPTYSCVVEFDPAGKVREVYAEDVPQALPLQSANYVVLDADAYGMADLVSRWRTEASPLLQSVVWYRLPVAQDRLNWPLDVLAKVALGESLKRGWLAHCKKQEAGHVEVVIEQAGDAPDDLPTLVTLHWAGSEAVGADALGGYQVVESAAGYLSLKLVNPGRMPRVGSGTKRVIGWLRVEGSTGPVDIFAKAIR